jgi:hypothetical protein
MSADTKIYKDRVGYLLDLAGRTLQTKETDTGTIPRQRVNRELFAEFRSSALSLLLATAGENHPLYKEFDRQVMTSAPADVEKGRGILKSLKADLESGLLPC